jgi:hypothetical protein
VSATLSDAEQRLLLHMRAMGGWLGAGLTVDEHRVMGDLVRYGHAELIGDGAQRRYALTVSGAQVAEQLANR